MAGINLSSSVPEKSARKSGLFDKSFIIISIVFFLVLAGFGGMRWYIKTLDTRVASLIAASQAQSSQLQGASVDRIVHFDDRLTLIGEQLAGDRTDSQKLLNQLESLTIPNVRLTKYEYNEAEKTVEVEGITDNFKYVAQQIISFKSESLFSKIIVQALDRTEEGLIEFSFKAEFN